MGKLNPFQFSVPDEESALRWKQAARGYQVFSANQNLQMQQRPQPKQQEEEEDSDA